MEKDRRSGLRSKSLKQDDSIMGTNNSSIVSKRSVERLYYPNEPHFFRYFVKKPQRRAPLINRGYWLRMKAIDHVVRQFLEQPSDKGKVVINLGCGYDPLPWQCLTRYPEASRGVKFIDIDYTDLMLRKRTVVQETPQLNGMLTNIATYDSKILLQSDQYAQLGCDLRDLTNLSETLSSVIDLENSRVLLISEVAITYMNVEAADALIQWAGTLPHAQFCLLEQLLPEGEDHPFAKTMMAHFEKLQTPLRAVQKYPTTEQQEKRFRDASWTDVSVKNLWELWASDFLSPEERMSLDMIEPFDEWEEFALLGCHYFLLVARNETSPNSITPYPAIIPGTKRPAMASLEQRNASFNSDMKSGGCRRFSASLRLRGPESQQDVIGCFGGMGLNTRLDSFDVYSKNLDTLPFYQKGPTSGPSARVCHTITDLGDTGSILVGGRSSPDKALADCWIYHKWVNIWERIDDIPEPRYRHSAVRLPDGKILVMGGKYDSRTIAKNPLIWSRTSGWRTAALRTPFTDDQEPAVFGAILACTNQEAMKGIFVGGILKDGQMNQNIWSWALSDIEDGKPVITCKQVHNTDDSWLTRRCRFGATVIAQGTRVFAVGGVTADRLLEPREEVLALDTSIGEGFPSIGRIVYNLRPRPLLVGCSAMLLGDELVIMGGGAVCFSMGSFWNAGCYTLQVGKRMDNVLQEQIREVEPWKYLRTLELATATSTLQDTPINTTSRERAHPSPIPRMHVKLEDEFSRIVARGQPFILANTDLGACGEAWTNEYLLDRIGSDRQVIVHRAATQHMDFVSKNFEYIKMSFGEFIGAVNNGDRLYLRSLSADRPSELPADISRDFPTICGDFNIPAALRTVTENAHSSPLRISGPVTMWLHYDVMANVLCQIRGTKRLLLFPPTDVRHFGFAPGSSSSSMNVFDMLDDARLAQTHPHEAILEPGDVLYIPPFWLHTTKPTDGISISVNVFFKNMASGYAAGRDVYGNRDLAAYEKGRKDIQKIAKSFDDLPFDVRSFYLQRLADELSLKAESRGNC